MHIERKNLYKNAGVTESAPAVDAQTASIAAVDRKPRGKVKLAVAAALVLALIAGGAGTVAFLTQEKTVENPFTMSTDGVKIEIDEGSWDPEIAKNVLPLQVVAKQPSVQNTGDIEVWAMMTVKMPTLTCTAEEKKLVDENGVPQSADKLAIFKMGSGDGSSFVEGTNSKWKLISTDNSTEPGFVTYAFGYTDRVAAGSQTETLFDSVQYINVTEEAGIANGSIVVKGYASQAAGFDNVEEAWEAYQNQGTGETD